MDLGQPLEAAVCGGGSFICQSYAKKIECWIIGVYGAWNNASSMVGRN